MRALEGIRVLDFTTLAPGPLATLILAEAGAEVIKVERPDGGDPMRAYPPFAGGEACAFALLNRGKRSLALDLKDPEERARLEPLIVSSQVLVEQFRPGVMARLGLDWPSLRARHPHLVYCSITGYGQHGPRAADAGHDLNYMALSGLLAFGAGASGEPVVPPALVADVGGGSLPAVIAILLALRKAEASGEGCYLDVAMTENLFAWAFQGFATLASEGRAPRPGGELLTGGSPRYQLYRTADGAWLAAAALEPHFWAAFCEAIDLPAALRDDARDPAKTTAAVAERIAHRSAAEWAEVFTAVDCCCCLVRDLKAATADRHFLGRGLFDAKLETAEGEARALPSLLPPALRVASGSAAVPSLGEANAELLGPAAGRATE